MYDTMTCRLFLCDGSVLVAFAMVAVDAFRMFNASMYTTLDSTKLKSSCTDSKEFCGSWDTTILKDKHAHTHTHMRKGTFEPK